MANFVAPWLGHTDAPLHPGVPTPTRRHGPGVSAIALYQWQVEFSMDGTLKARLETASVGASCIVSPSTLPFVA